MCHALENFDAFAQPRFDRVEEIQMPRDYFRRVAPGYTIVAGTIISDIQATLNASGGARIAVDGRFGAQTADALLSFQARRNLSVTGTVSDSTWAALFHTSEPPIFERCLQVTASFEGTGFTRVVGNFDGAGITWGIAGFTLLNGELGALLATIKGSNPAIVGEVFSEDADEITWITSEQTPRDQKLSWADSISRGPQKYDVAEPWRTYFYNLGARTEVQKIQVGRARQIYWKIAVEDAENIGFQEELDLLLMYDIAVQNGGLDARGCRQAVQRRFQSESPATEQDKRHIIAEVVADAASPRWKQDVLGRKLTIANGKGDVHGGNYTLFEWGFLDGVKPSTTA